MCRALWSRIAPPLRHSCSRLTPNHEEAPMSKTPKIVSLLLYVAGAVLIVAGAFTWYTVTDQLAAAEDRRRRRRQLPGRPGRQRPVRGLLPGPDHRPPRHGLDRRQDLRRARSGRPGAPDRHDRVLPAGLAVHLGGRLRCRGLRRRAWACCSLLIGAGIGALDKRGAAAAVGAAPTEPPTTRLTQPARVATTVPVALAGWRAVGRAPVRQRSGQRR